MAVNWALRRRPLGGTGFWTYDAVVRLLSDGGRKRGGNTWSIGFARWRAALSQKKVCTRQYLFCVTSQQIQ